MNPIFRFICYVLTRFAKTFGCIFFVAGFAVAGWLYQQREPIIDSARYHESNLLAGRIRNLESQYGNTQQLVKWFKGAAEFPTEYAAAAFTPKFSEHYLSAKDFQDLQGELAQVGSAKDAMKRFVVDNVEVLLSDIQQKLIAHAATLTSDTAPKSSAKISIHPDFGLYDNHINDSEVSSRKSTLDAAKQFLGVLQSSAENPENRDKLQDSIAEIDVLSKLLPSNTSEVSLGTSAAESKQPLNAERVANRINQIRNSIRQAVLSSWALDEAADLALQTAEAERNKFSSSEYRVKQLSEELNIKMAMAITAGVVLGLFFLLIGDWTQKSSTELLTEPWCHLIENFNASPKGVYETVEKCVAARKVPDLETTREFWHEGGALSSKREYLRFARERLQFEICAAPFGTGFFLSFRTVVTPFVVDPLAIFFLLTVLGGVLIALVNSFGLLWGAIILVLGFCVFLFLMRTAVARSLANLDRALMKTPLIGTLYELFVRHDTYYRKDTRAAYVQAVQGAVAEAFQSMFGDQGVSLLPATVSKPVMDKIYRKRFQ